jgi:hypothetical protein
MGSWPRWARTSHTRSFFLRLADPSVLVPDDLERLRLSRHHTTLMINGNRPSSLFLA